MNKAKWTPALPWAILAVKLTEEAAEVGTLVTDAWMSDAEPDRDKLLMELGHVEFLCSVLRAKAGMRRG